MYSKWQVPIIQGGMGVGVSMGSLAGAVAREGGMGVISTALIGFREPDAQKSPLEAAKRALRKEIEKAKEYAQGKGKIAINAMVVTNDYKEMLKEAVSCGIDAIISGAGMPLELPKLVSNTNVMLAPIVSGKRATELIIKAWSRYNRKPDFIVAEGKDAGGHLGFKGQEVLDGTAPSLEETVKGVVEAAGEIPVFAGGSVFDVSDIKKIISWGAVGAQIATRFIATEECDASYGFKKVILNAKEEDIAIIQSPVGLPGRAIKTPLIAGLDGKMKKIRNCINCISTCNPAKTPYCISRALIEGFYGNIESGLFFAGANVGKVNEMTTVPKLMAELKQAFE
ncbi:MAG: NAD(P)H-dependent flavin oxidoreductase [Eubacteriales bacterium]